ncbi:CpaF family protein [Candidatus Woesearchaeota archaeon]|nr:CpaF family protein [Candidatus Woesearchaeota archaeon]
MELSQYEINLDGFKIKASINGVKAKATKYTLTLPEFTKPTLALVDEIRNKLITEVNLSATEILDPKIVETLKVRFRKRAEEMLMEEVPSLETNTKKVLIVKLLHEMLGLGNIEFLLEDENLEEIVVNSAGEPVRVYHKKLGWLTTNVLVSDETQISNYADIIARRVGRQITTLDPLLDAHLVTGDRANAVLFPVSAKGNTITIRKFARDPWTVVDFINSKTCTPDIFALIWLAVQFEMNVLISGGTASGKTSMLNVCMPFIPPNHRVVSMEDTRELQLPRFLYWCPLTTRLPNPEGKGEVSMLDLLVNSLRMRPDRIILGEIRRQQEAEVLFEAMHTGHSVYATVHADSINETITRLVNPPISVPPNLLGAVNINIVMFRDRRLGIRRVSQIGEFVVSEEDRSSTVKPNILYRWKPTTDEIVPHNKSIRLFEELNRHTGMSQQDINKDLAEKKMILTWMVKQKYRQIDQVGLIVKEYYRDPESLLKIVKANKKLETPTEEDS